MKNMNKQKWILCGLILLFAILSFAPCIRVGYKYQVPMEMIDGIAMGGYLEYAGYCPIFCCIISFIELLLLFRPESTDSKVARLILNPVKMIVPIPLCKLIDQALASVGDAYGDSYSLSSLGYLIVGLGLLIEIVEAKEFFQKKKQIQISDQISSDN